jgi:hypothetical protein
MRSNPYVRQRGNFFLYSKEFVMSLIMNISSLKTFTTVASLTATFLCLPALLRAQAPAGPLPSDPSQPSAAPAAKPSQPAVDAKPRTSILGGWKLNRDESDDPRQKLQSARGSGGGGGSRGGGVRMGIPGMGGGPIGGGGRRGSGQGGGDNDQDRERMQAVIAPANALTLSQKEPKGPEVDLADDQNRTTAFFTDGRKLEKPKDASNQEVAAHWDGNRLVTDEKNPRGGKMSRTYELSYDGMQLYETVSFTMGRSNSPATIRYVYDQSASSPKAQAR